MKKHFLIIALFSLIFLGLENNTFADQICGLKTCISPQTCNQTTLTCVSPSGFGQGGSTTDNTTISVCNGCTKLPTLEYSKGCDTTKYNQKGTADGCDAIYCCPKALGTACHPPYGGELNVFGMCGCPDGKKDVDGTCKPCSEKGVCCGVELNTAVPFIGKCIEDGTSAPSPDETSVTDTTAFPVLMGSLTKILVTLILIISFVLIIIGGIMIATGNPSGGKKMIINVVIAIALLGASGVILRLVNPNFFG